MGEEKKTAPRTDREEEKENGGPGGAGNELKRAKHEGAGRKFSHAGPRKVRGRAMREVKEL